MKVSKDELRQMCDSGLTAQEIASKTGMNLQHVYKRIRKNGFTLNHDPKWFEKRPKREITYGTNAEGLRKMMELYRRGKSDKYIADVLHISKSSVCGWRKANELPPNRTIRVREMPGERKAPKPVPYEKMSRLAKRNHEAREAGLTYGQHMARLFALGR